MPGTDRKLPAKIRRSAAKPYADRLKALREGQAVYDAVLTATYEMEQAIPNERLALFDRLWFSQGESGPLVGAWQAWRRIETNLEYWEQELESESELKDFSTKICIRILKGCQTAI